MKKYKIITQYIPGMGVVQITYAKYTTPDSMVNKTNGRKAIYRVYDDGFQIVVRYHRGLYKGKERVANHEEARSIMKDWVECKV